MKQQDTYETSELLIPALTAVQRYQYKTIVVKYGGNAMISPGLTSTVIEDALCMSRLGIRLALVHGGGPEIEALLKAVGKESRFVNGLRYTDAETMEIVQMALCGKVNKDIVSLIQQKGGYAIGVCGIDGGLLKARRIAGGEDLGFVGAVETVEPTVVTAILNAGAIPVIAPVALGIGPDAGHSLNVNADTAAANIAGALRAERFFLMTDVQGILRDMNNPDSLITRLTKPELDALKQAGIVSKGMIPKTDSCRIALDKGVPEAHILDGRTPHALLKALFTDEPVGTIITN